MQQSVKKLRKFWKKVGRRNELFCCGDNKQNRSKLKKIKNNKNGDRDEPTAIARYAAKPPRAPRGVYDA
jgi:hypothetical protein